MADPTPGRDGAAWFTDQISRLQGQIDQLKSPSGTQQFNAVPKLQEQIDGLTVVQTQQASQISFLQGQASFGSRTNQSGGTRPASGGLSFEAFDPTYDIELGVTTAGPRLLVTVSALIGAIDISAGIGFEVLWPGGSIGVDWPRAAMHGGGISTPSRTVVVDVPASTAVTVRTRRFWTGGVTGSVQYGYPTLLVQKLL